jgi:hypothetical protein
VIGRLSEEVVQTSRCFHMEADIMFAGVADTAEYLDRLVRDLPVGFAGYRFGQVNTVLGRYSIIEFPQALLGTPFRGVHMIDHFDDKVLDSLKPADRLAELYSCTGVIHGSVEQGFAGTGFISTENRD